MGGLTKPTAGTVLVDGVDLWSLDDKEQSRVRAEKIGFIFQIPSLITTMNVMDNVRLPTMFPERRENVGKEVMKLLELVGLSEKVGAHPSQLSVGQQKRVALARALINHPEILLADEPTSDLDRATEGEIMSLIQELHQGNVKTIVMVTHNLDLAKFGTKIYKMANGLIEHVECTDLQPSDLIGDKTT
jgi:ABC-type lipoprotein export system ATPase subunit